MKGALAMPLMIKGYKKDLIKFAIITCRKPEKAEARCHFHRIMNQDSNAEDDIYLSIDLFSINCGSLNNFSIYNGRNWTGDMNFLSQFKATITLTQ
ncbi:hypothetical protein Fmac_017395 [Flemingia macrophylla]|uniref:Uncharacterized protein n=1 Tax=Flemingia macrophylla TaxID=520843 RepID=A0ABD1M206_9FABA